MTIRTERHALTGARRPIALVCLLLIGLTACDTDRWLKVSAPSALPSESLETPEAAALLVNGAIGNFECALGATIMVSGIIADEFADAQLGAAQWPYDRRDANVQPSGIYGTSGCTSAQGPGVYSPLSVARWSADNAFRALEGFTDDQVPQRDSLMAASALYAGFSLAHLGMTMCSAAIDEGPEMSNMELFAEAEERFGTALTLATQAGIDDYQFRAVLAHCSLEKVRNDRMGFGRIGAGDDERFQMLHFGNGVGHRAGADGKLQAGDRAGMTEPGAVVDVVGAHQGAH